MEESQYARGRSAAIIVPEPGRAMVAAWLKYVWSVMASARAD